MTRDYYALNISEPQIDKMIQLTETEMAGQMAAISVKEGPFKEAQELYQIYKREFDALTDGLEANKLLLESLSRFKHNTKASKEIRVMRTTSHVDQKPVKKQLRQIKWVKIIIEALQAENKFLSFEDLVRLLPKYGAPQPDVHQRNSLRNNMLRSVKIVMSGNQKKQFFNDSLVLYKERFGLLSWCLDDYTPDANHVKEFMYDRPRKII